MSHRARESPEAPLRLTPLLTILLTACPMQVDDQGASSKSAPAAPTAPSAAAPTAPATSGSGAAPGAPQGGPAPQSSDGVPIRLDVQPPREDDPAWTQAKLAEADHVVFSGTVRCEACAAPMVLRALPFQPPEALSTGLPPSPLTTLPMPEAGSFTLLVPRGSQAVVLELLVDLDGNGHPDRGERMSVVVRDGKLVPDHDVDGLLIDATDSESGPWPAMGPDNGKSDH